jgi:hypothetical protein
MFFSSQVDEISQTTILTDSSSREVLFKQIELAHFGKAFSLTIESEVKL